LITLAVAILTLIAFPLAIYGVPFLWCLIYLL